jgi:2-polyprenyl-3-methyl-5-hydroxy-6-metoxy-1,4-benzoquinol methylase
MVIPSKNILKYHSNCLICGSSSINQLKQYTKGGLVQCLSCKFVFCKQIPTSEELIRHYETYPRHDTISSITVKRFRELALYFEKYRNTGNWLDNGCGNGHLLVTARENNWNVYGTEFTDIAVTICRKKGIIMHQGALDISNYKEGQFDIITFIEVLEHINNPVEEIEKFRKLIRKGGALYITTPNFNSLSRFILKDRWSVIEYPEHLSYYTTSTIHKLLSEHGFKKVYLKTSGFSTTRLSSGVQKNDSKPLLNEEQIREIAESNILVKSAKNIINSFLNITNKGDTIKALYLKQ